MAVLIDTNNKVNSTARNRILQQVDGIMAQLYLAIGRVEATEEMAPKIAEAMVRKIKEEAMAELSPGSPSRGTVRMENDGGRRPPGQQSLNETKRKVTFADVTKAKSDSLKKRFVTTIVPS